MSSKASAHRHIFPALFMGSGTFRQKKLILGRHHASQNRKPYGASMKMAGQRQIGSPLPVCLKKERRMGQKDLKMIPAGRPQLFLYISLIHQCQFFGICLFIKTGIQFQPGNPYLVSDPVQTDLLKDRFPAS